MKQQLSLFNLEQFTTPALINSVYDRTWDEIETVTNTVLEQTQQTPNPDSNVLEQDKQHTNQSAPEQSHWVEKYTVARYHKEHYYYRYLWMSGRKLHHVHIPGGNVRSPLAQHRKQTIESAIAAGQPPMQIEKLIRSWRQENGE